MSIITDALKKAQKERIPSARTDPRKNAENTPDIPALRHDSGFGKLQKKNLIYVLYAASLTVAVTAIFAVLFLGALLSERPARNGSASLSGEQQQPSIPKRTAPSPAVKIEPFSISIPHIVPKPSAPAKPVPELTGIMYLPTSPQAVINGRTIKEGDEVDGYTVIKIYPESVKLSLDGVEKELKLK